MKSRERKKIFVSGTGTGIGKTFISAILAEALHADYWKPVQAGYAVTDSDWVRTILSNKQSSIHPEIYKLKLAASPHIAARQENITISLQKIVSQMPTADHDLIIEGAGGLMVPLNDHEFVTDLIKMLDLPVILVSRNTLGSINFSLLTAMACKQKNIKVIGWIFNDNYLNYENDIAKWSGIPSLASIPFASRPDSAFIKEQAERIKEQMDNWPWLKKEIRSIYIDKRNQLAADEVKEMTERIVNNFRTIALQGAQVLLSYYPIPERREFNVKICEELLTLENDKLQVAWPRLMPDNTGMQAIAIHKNTILALNRFNILEPAEGNEIIEPQLIDVVFVPLLAFDNKGFRVGYGKGFYDRFLPQCAQDVVKIGFSYFEALDAIDDINEYDVPLNYCITPTRVYEF